MRENDCEESVEKPEKGDLFGDKATSDGPWRSTQSFRDARVVSCGSRDHRWRTKLDLGSGESFDDHHRSSALGTEPKITGVPAAWTCPVRSCALLPQPSN